MDSLWLTPPEHRFLRQNGALRVYVGPEAWVVVAKDGLILASSIYSYPVSFHVKLARMKGGRLNAKTEIRNPSRRLRPGSAKASKTDDSR